MTIGYRVFMWLIDGIIYKNYQCVTYSLFIIYRVLTGCYDNTINIWSTKGKHEVTIRDHTNLVKAVAWIEQGNPAGGFVSVSHDLTGILWEWTIGESAPEMKAVLRGHERGIDTVGVSPDSSRLATGGWDTNLKLWSTSLEQDNEPPQKKTRAKAVTKTPLCTLKGHKESISKALWIDNMTVCTASMDHTIKTWDAEVSIEGRKCIEWLLFHRDIITIS